jgi:hypothetical protein
MSSNVRQKNKMRDSALMLSFAIRFLGVGLGLLVILGSLIPDLPMEMAPARPHAMKLIGEPPSSFLLFGWFLLPYSLAKSKWFFWPFALALTIASAVSVISASEIFSFYRARQLPAGDPTLGLIGLSLGTCILQPVAVITARWCRLQTPKAEPTGTGQPATRPVVKPEGGDKPQPEAEGRAR